MAFRMYVDKEGIPYSDYGKYKGMHIGEQRSILSVAERGIWYWNNFLKSRNENEVLLSYDWEDTWPVNREINPTDIVTAKQMFINCSNLLLDNINDHGTHHLWVYSYQMSYGTNEGWGSAHAQIVGIQLLIRAFELTNEEKYFVPINKLLDAFKYPLENGGLADRTEKGLIWYEKFADPNNQKPKVLNGLLFTLLGLKDVYERTKIKSAIRYYKKGKRTALKLINKFDILLLFDNLL